MDEAQSQQPRGPLTKSLEGGDLHFVIVPDQDHEYSAISFEEDPDLAMDLPGDLGQLPGDLRCDDLVRRYFSTVQAL